MIDGGWRLLQGGPPTSEVRVGLESFFACRGWSQGTHALRRRIDASRSQRRRGVGGNSGLFVRPSRWIVHPLQSGEDSLPPVPVPHPVAGGTTGAWHPQLERFPWRRQDRRPPTIVGR